MVTPATGTVVLVTFPFSDLSRSKVRPAVVLAAVGFNDWILCQITSNPYADSNAVPITHSDFVSGSLQRDSFARPGKLFTADSRLISSQAGELGAAKFNEVLSAVLSVLSPETSSPNPYAQFVSQYAQLIGKAKSVPLGGFDPAPRPILAPDAPKVLIFAPHPDDECIIGGLPLRLLREAKMNVINVAVTQGSKKERQTERYFELQKACHYLGFGLMQTAQGGLEKINVRTRAQDRAHWDKSVGVIADILEGQEPRVIFFPHEHDWNSSHIGTHFLVMDALKKLENDLTCYLVETEFWGQMTSPNLMVESSYQDVADLVAGTSFHVGEVKRNPYHALLPAWMLDNVRRGTELVGGQGQAAPDFTFATLYQLRLWKEGAIQEVGLAKNQLGIGDDPTLLFPGFQST